MPLIVSASLNQIMKAVLSYFHRKEKLRQLTMWADEKKS